MPVQKTFTLVPAVTRDASPVSAFAGGRMTSKQVKQAYKTGNKAPRMSKAEQIKMERAEQQRIRKEMEKEKAAAKARLLREKKKEKEMAERDMKRREGKPLVNVRPSQDTIARFARRPGMSVARKRDCDGALVDIREDVTPAADEPKPSSNPGDSSIKVTNTVVKNEEEAEEAVSAEDGQTSLTCDKEYQPNPVAVHCTTDSLARMEAALDDNLLSDLLKDYESSGDVPGKTLQQAEPEPKPIKQDDETESLIAILDEEPELHLSRDATHAAPAQQTHIFPGQLPDTDLAHLDALLEDDFGSDILNELENVIHSREPDVSRLPGTDYSGSDTKHAKACIAIGCDVDGTGQIREDNAEIPAASSRHSTESPPRPVAPMSTQSIMLNIDDFFPTASQQALELDEEADNFGVVRESVKPRHSMPPPATPAQTRLQRSSRSPRASYSANQTRKSMTSTVPCAKQTPSPSPRPEPWFTASGSRELQSLAIQRSRRTAALEQMQQKERLRTESLAGGTNEHDDTILRDMASREHYQVPVEDSLVKRRCLEDKENVVPSASQETDYGGGWVEDFEF